MLHLINVRMGHCSDVSNLVPYCLRFGLNKGKVKFQLLSYRSAKIPTDGMKDLKLEICNALCAEASCGVARHWIQVICRTPGRVALGPRWVLFSQSGRHSTEQKDMPLSS